MPRGTPIVQGRAGMTRGAVAWLLAACALAPASQAQVYPGVTWETATPAEMDMDGALLSQARSFAGGAGMIVRSGRVVLSWEDTHARHELKSATKSLGSLLLGIAIGDGLLALDDPAEEHLASVGVPLSSNLATGWVDRITNRSLATHSGGFPEPGDYSAFLYEPRTAWQYSNCGVDWLGDVLTVRFADDLADVLRDRVLDAIGVPANEFAWQPHAYRELTLQGIPRRQIASGVTASVDALARIGLLCLREGMWNGVELVPSAYAARMGQADASIAALANLDPSRYPGATARYGLLWWSNSAGTLDAPLDAYFAWGLWESLIVVIPSLDVVAARLGDGWQDPWTSDYAVVAPFIEPIAASVLLPSGASVMTFESWGRVKSQYRADPPR